MIPKPRQLLHLGNVSIDCCYMWYEGHHSKPPQCYTPFNMLPSNKFQGITLTQSFLWKVQCLYSEMIEDLLKKWKSDEKATWGFLVLQQHFIQIFFLFKALIFHIKIAILRLRYRVKELLCPYDMRIDAR